jgi:hypothetical protein
MNGVIEIVVVNAAVLLLSIATGLGIGQAVLRGVNHVSRNSGKK